MSEYRAIQFCQFSRAHCGTLACAGDLPVMGRAHFQGQTGGAFWLRPEMDESFQGLTLQQGASPALCNSGNAEFGPWHLQICPGSKRQISVGLPIPTYPPEKARHEELGEIRS